MSEEQENTQSIDSNMEYSEQVGLGTEDMGKASVPEEGTEQSADTGKQLEGAGLPDGMTPEVLAKSYKEIQGKFTKTSQENAEIRKQMETIVKQAERYGGIEQLFNTANQLSNNPQFQEWIQRQQMGGQYDEETMNALNLVRNIATNVVKQEIQQAMKTQVEPLANTYKEQNIMRLFGKMDEKYGAEWREMSAEMNESAGEFPIAKLDNPTLDDLEDLYMRALRKTGKFDDFAAKSYEKRLKDKKDKATGIPASSPAGTGKTPKPKNIHEAADNVERAGITYIGG